MSKNNFEFNRSDLPPSDDGGSKFDMRDFEYTKTGEDVYSELLLVKSMEYIKEIIKKDPARSRIQRKGVGGIPSILYRYTAPISGSHAAHERYYIESFCTGDERDFERKYDVGFEVWETGKRLYGQYYDVEEKKTGPVNGHITNVFSDAGSLGLSELEPKLGSEKDRMRLCDIDRLDAHLLNIDAIRRQPHAAAAR